MGNVFGCCKKDQVSDVKDEPGQIAYDSKTVINNQSPDVQEVISVRPNDDQWNKKKEIVVKIEEKHENEEWITLIDHLLSNKYLMNYAKAKSRTQFRLVKDVGEYLSKCSHVRDELERAWLVYVWITHNITYDVENFLSKNYKFNDPQTVLERGLGVCAGYADLYKELCSHLGVKCETIGGFSKGVGYKIGQKMTEESHAWNGITLADGRFFFVESTWGAGHLDDTMEFNKEFEPHWFATPPNVFNESHFSNSFSPTNNRFKWTLEQFETCANNQLEYHILGIRCLDQYNNIVGAVIRTSKNPLVIEYTSKHDLVLSATLTEEKSGRKLENYFLVQNDYENHKYCLIVYLPEKNTNYLLKLFGSKKDGKGDDVNMHPLLAKYLVVRDGDESSYIPRYNLSFDYGIKLKSHYFQKIEFTKNPLVMKFYVPTTTKTLFKITKQNGDMIENGILAQKNPEDETQLCLYVSLPSKSETYILSLYANYTSVTSNTHKHVSAFHLVRTQTSSNNLLQLAKFYTAGENSFIYSPIEYMLETNKAYEFKYFIRDALDVALVGADKEWIHMKKSSDNPNVWCISVETLKTGKLNVFAKFGQGSSYTGICYYEVEDIFIEVRL